MNRFRSGLVPLFALLAVAGCNSEPTDELREGIARLEASPTQLFIEVGRTKNVQVGAVDAQGNPLDFNYEVTAVGPGITVRRDSSFLPIFVDDTTLQAPATGPRFQFIVEGNTYTATSFTVSAGGQDIQIPVQVIPQQGLAATFSNPTPALGEAVTLTASEGVTFNPDATLQTGETDITILSQDATTITFIPPPNVNGPITVNGVQSAGAPGVTFSPATDSLLTTPLIDTVDVTYSTVTPTLGQTVTLTSPNPLIQIAMPATDTLSGIVYPGQLPGREPGPTAIVVAPDSNSVSFAAPPNAAGNGSVQYFHFPGNYLISLPTRPVLTSQNIGTTLPVGINDTVPDVSEVVTLTAPAGFTFDDTTNITLGGRLAVTTSRAADGSTVSFVAFPGSAGIPQIDGIVPAASPLNRLTMPAANTVTVPSTVPTLAGSDDPATAPALPVPGLGETSVTFDAPDFVATIDHFYRIDVPANATYRMTLDWNVGSDVDFYVCGSGCDDPFGADLVQGTTVTGTASFFPGATSAHPEVGIYTLTAGTYWLLAEDFGEDAAGTTLTISLRRTQ